MTEIDRKRTLMMYLRRGCIGTFLTLILTSPVSASDEPPSCRIEPGAEESGAANAGCFVVVGERLLLVHERYRGVWSIPGGTSIRGESAQCTAARETWEESGAEVVVGARLHTFENGFQLFLCRWDTPPEGFSEDLPLPDWARNEVDDVTLVDPRRLEPEQYRFPGQLNLIRDLYESNLGIQAQ
jgi:8-oxo-dGTP diphosphatase